MSLKDIMNDLSKFEPGKDSVNSNDFKIPAGEYNATLTNIEHKTFKSGWDCIGFDFEIEDGEQAGKTEMVNLSFAEMSKNGNEIPDFVLERNAKTVLTIAKLTGTDMSTDVFMLPNETDIHEKIAQELTGKKGISIKLKIIDVPNKKDPDNPYRNYEFYALDGEGGNNGDIDVSDQLPDNLDDDNNNRSQDNNLDTQDATNDPFAKNKINDGDGKVTNPFAPKE